MKKIDKLFSDCDKKQLDDKFYTPALNKFLIEVYWVFENISHALSNEEIL